jgi:hypothetical protein
MPVWLLFDHTSYLTVLRAVHKFVLPLPPVCVSHSTVLYRCAVKSRGEVLRNGEMGGCFIVTSLPLFQHFITKKEMSVVPQFPYSMDMLSATSLYPWMKLKLTGKRSYYVFKVHQNLQWVLHCITKQSFRHVLIISKLLGLLYYHLRVGRWRQHCIIWPLNIFVYKYISINFE